MRTIAIIGTNGLPAKYGGFETLCNYLVDNFDKNTYKILVYCSKTPKKNRLKSYNGAKLIYFPLKANGWQSMLYDFVTIIHAFFKANDLIILGFSGAFAFPINKLFKKNIIFNIGGIEWKKVRGSKITSKFEVLLKKYMEQLCVYNSNTVIIDNLAFKDYIINRYGKEPVLAEYGGDHAKKIGITNELLLKYPFLDSKYTVSVSRAQEDMNIHVLIDAFKEVPEKKIVIVSNWHISDYGKELYENNLDKYENIILLKAVYDETELNAIRSNAQLYIHCHSLCGTAPSLVEAMCMELPVVSFDVPTNRETTENKSMYFDSSAQLRDILKSLNEQTLHQLKNEMTEISQRRYTWKRVSSIYQNNLSL